MSRAEPEPIIWSKYAIDGPTVGRPLHEVSRKVAEEYFNSWVGSLDRRIAALRALTESNSIDMENLIELSDWYFGHITENPEQPGRMASRWYAVAMDIAMYLSERLIDEAESELRWEMVTKPKKDISYQRPVIRGFNVPYPLYYVDYFHGIGVSGQRVIANKEIRPNLFAEMLDHALSKSMLNASG